VQDLIRHGEIDLVRSFMLDYENAASPFEEVRRRIARWKGRAAVDCAQSNEASNAAGEMMKLGLRPKDAAHIACAIQAADCFLTTGKKIPDKSVIGVQILNPVDFVRRCLDA
jgi:hypothetical protein